METIKNGLALVLVSGLVLFTLWGSLNASEVRECELIAQGVQPLAHEYQKEMCDHHNIEIDQCQITSMYPPHTEGGLFEACQK